MVRVDSLDDATRCVGVAARTVGFPFDRTDAMPPPDRFVHLTAHEDEITGCPEIAGAAPHSSAGAAGTKPTSRTGCRRTGRRKRGRAVAPPPVREVPRPAGVPPAAVP